MSNRFNFKGFVSKTKTKLKTAMDKLDNVQPPGELGPSPAVQRRKAIEGTPLSCTCLIAQLAQRTLNEKTKSWRFSAIFH